MRTPRLRRIVHPLCRGRSTSLTVRNTCGEAVSLKPIRATDSRHVARSGTHERLLGNGGGGTNSAASTAVVNATGHLQHDEDGNAGCVEKGCPGHDLSDWREPHLAYKPQSPSRGIPPRAFRTVRRNQYRQLTFPPFVSPCKCPPRLSIHRWASESYVYGGTHPCVACDLQSSSRVGEMIVIPYRVSWPRCTTSTLLLNRNPPRMCPRARGYPHSRPWWDVAADVLTAAGLVLTPGVLERQHAPACKNRWYGGGEVAGVAVPANGRLSCTCISLH